MDFSTIGSVSGYINNLKMETKWNQKKMFGDFSPEKKKLTDVQKKNEQFKAAYKESQKENNDNDSKISEIYSKINSGAALTAAELQYLQTKDPLVYQKMKSDRAERKTYEHKLKKCKTKEDVHNLRLSALSKSVSNINSIQNNPNISDDKKYELSVAENDRVNQIVKITEKFMRSSKYAKLVDTNAELAKAEHDVEEAKKLHIDNKKEDEFIEENNENVNLKPIDESENKDRFSEDVKSDDDIMIKQEKVKRSKAAAAYSAISDSEFDDAGISSLLSGGIEFQI